MSNFKNFSKSVKKSLCVLASASSIFSILPTAMAMKPTQETSLSCEIVGSRRQKQIAFIKLINYFEDNAIKCTDIFEKNEGRFDEIVHEKEKEYGIEDDFNWRKEHSEDLIGIYKKMFEEDHIANCRVANKAIQLKAKELGIDPNSICEYCLIELGENNTYIYGTSKKKHIFTLVRCEDKTYIFDISFFMCYYKKHRKRPPKLIGLEQNVYSSIAASINHSVRFTHILLNGEIWKNIEYKTSKEGNTQIFDIEFKDPKPGEKVNWDI